MSDSQVRHPIFARCFNRLAVIMEPEVGTYRDRLLAGLSGRVLEVGAGNGINFGHYPDTVAEVVALEPEPYLRRKAERAAAQAAVRVEVRDGVADQLRFEPGSFDAVVASLVLCTVPDPGRALSEMRRVLNPGGELRFMEHVRSDRASKARVQSLADRSGLWPLIGGGCHCSRPTVATIEAAGYDVQEVESIDLGPSWVITNPHVIGLARAPA